MRENNNLMRALAIYTRVSPTERIKKLNAFNRRLQSEQEVLREIRDWKLQLDNQLVTLQGRVLPADTIFFKDDVKVKVDTQANWNKEFRNKSLLKVGCLEDWVVMTTQRVARDVHVSFCISQIYSSFFFLSLSKIIFF